MGTPTSRRDRLRAEAFAEIGALGMAQVARGGAAALSLSAIAREMGMSGPAIYRYFPSRDALLARLVADTFTSLADAIGASLAGRREDVPGRRFRIVAGSYRDWALAHPREYVLLTTWVPESEGRAEMVAATQRTLDLLCVTLRDVAPRGPRAVPPAPHPAWLVRAGVVAWQRLHGHVALELEGLQAALGVDPATLYDDECDAIVEDLRRRPGARRGQPAPLGAREVPPRPAPLPR